MLIDMCDGCPKASDWAATGWVCTVYARPWQTLWARHNKKCPFNGGMITQGKLTLRKSVGQQRNTWGKK